MAGVQKHPSVAPDPRSAGLVEPERLWYAARYTDCIQTLRGAAPSAERFLLASRAYYRLRRYRDAIETLESADPYFNGGDSRLERSTVAAASCMALGDFSEAARYLGDLDAAHVAGCSERLRFEAAYTQALHDWLSGDFERGELRLQTARPRGNVQQANAGILLSWLSAAQERFAEQASFLQHAISLLRAEPVLDVGLLARAAYALASTVRECSLHDALFAIDALLQDLPWTTDIALDHFQTLRLSAWAHALQGNYIRAIHQLHQASDIAPSPFFDVLSRFDGAWVSKIADEQMSATAQAARAFELACDLSWERVNGEECTALLVGAELLAPRSQTGALQLLKMFDAVRPNIAPSIMLCRDRRLYALESFTRATIASHEADTNGVRHFAKLAYDIYESMGFEWRAARAAILLYRAGAGDPWLEKAMQHIAGYPRSFIAAEIAPLHDTRTSEPLRKLTARQRDVYTRLAQGASIDDIASDLGCSRNTVRIHIGVIYRHFGVRNRVEFMSKANTLKVS